MSAFVKNKDINLCIIYFASAKVFQSSSQNSLFIWSHELLPISYYYSVITLCETVSQLALISVPLIIFYSKKKEVIVMNGITLSLCLSIFGTLLLISALLGFTLPDTNHHKVSNSWHQNNTTLANHCQWSDVSQYPNHKKTLKNGILKNNGPQQQSPMISLLRKQELMRQKDYELEANDRITELNDSPNEICTIRVTFRTLDIEFFRLFSI
ncbi:unnamed protein product [Oppiella nova]|uniref:Uncharacterized protein n=1 Tax=Oppiella nova TaxID=334625 RepID=A0A7R9LBH5_9ACAR|nr:unnamed protein product [Oppiella nova]CAG2161903.1 unnamed protein product [Oppiella nova]